MRVMNYGLDSIDTTVMYQTQVSDWFLVQEKKRKTISLLQTRGSVVSFLSFNPFKSFVVLQQCAKCKWGDVGQFPPQRERHREKWETIQLVTKTNLIINLTNVWICMLPNEVEADDVVGLRRDKGANVLCLVGYKRVTLETFLIWANGFTRYVSQFKWMRKDPMSWQEHIL